VVTWPTITIRASTNPSNLVGGVRAAVAGLDRAIPVYSTDTLDDVVSKAAAEPRFQTLLFTGFAGIALLLAAVGLYGLLSYMVGQRAAEIGLRMALGCAARGRAADDLVRGVMLVVAGIAIGLLVSAC